MAKSGMTSWQRELSEIMKFKFLQHSRLVYRTVFMEIANASSVKIWSLMSDFLDKKLPDSFTVSLMMEGITTVSLMAHSFLCI
jgi:hypothetical protein